MRIKMSVNAKKNRKAVLKQAKGYWGARSKQYRVANEAVMKAGQYAFVGRKLKKRNFRSLWIARINAACRLNGTTYSKFMKLAKSVSGYASFFKPFSYQKMAPKKVNLNSYFSFSLFEITSKDKLINIYVQENISPTELVDFLSIIDTFIN